MKQRLMVMLLFIAATAGAQTSSTLLKGYAKMVRGEELAYESTEPEANMSLLVRSLDERNYIEWETEAIPADFNQDAATFVFIAGMDINKDDGHSFRLSVDGIQRFAIHSPADGRLPSLQWHSGGMKLDYKGLKLDKYGDYMGYMYLSVPRQYLSPGKPLILRVTGESAESRTWFMIFKYGCEESVRLIAENAVIATDEGPMQQMRLSIVNLQAETEGVITIGNQTFKRPLQRGLNVLRLPINALKSPRNYAVSVRAGIRLLYEGNLTVKPACQVTFHLLHHSHVDIGYTHVQDEVEEMQHQYLKEAVRQHKLNSRRPADARIKWNTEVMWAVESYLENASSGERRAFYEAVREGSIELNGLFGNMLVGLCNEEELYRLTEAGRLIASDCGVPLTSAMITDIPGWSWGWIPAMAQSGIRFLSLGTNPFHRIGDIIETWGDRPFYWQSADGKDSVLTWIHQKGYALFHAGLNLRQINYNRYEDLILAYADWLQTNDVAYECIPLRYNIGSDNGPIDTTLSDFVQQWNRRFITPRLKVSTVSEAFSEFEKKYGHTLPVLRGDITGYWEDGAASSALETAINQASAERLVQAERIFALFQPEKLPQSSFRDAWRQVMLFDEHTWGAHNSISEPEGDFAKAQWAIKQNFATEGARLSEALLSNALPVEQTEAAAVTIVNTASWARYGIVTLPADMDLPQHPVLLDSDGERFAIQSLSNHQSVARVELPALASRTYRIVDGGSTPVSALTVTDSTLENQWIAVTADKHGIRILDKSSGRMINNENDSWGFNQYVYVPGRDPADAVGAVFKSVHVQEAGPVLASLCIECDAPGAAGFVAELRLHDGERALEIINHVDKTLIYEPESVHFAFPFNMNKPVLRYGVANACVRLPDQMLPGANLNYPSFRRWVDASDDFWGVTLISRDAPIMEVGDLSVDATIHGWKDELKSDNLIFSYVMNNYWETNYCAAQEGSVDFSYLIVPHEAWSPEATARRARAYTRPLLAWKGSCEVMPAVAVQPESSVLLDAVKVLEPHALLLRWTNSGSVEAPLPFQWPLKKGRLYEADIDGTPGKAWRPGRGIKPGGIVFVRMAF